MVGHILGVIRGQWEVSIPTEARNANSKIGVAFVNNLANIFSLANSAKYVPSRVYQTQISQYLERSSGVRVTLS